MKEYPLIDLKKEFSCISTEVLPAIERILRGGKFILGDEVSEFEKSFSKYCNRKFCSGVASGTAALFLSLKALGIRGGDEVIIPSLTFASDAEVICYLGAKPVFVDVDESTFLIDPLRLRERVSNRTKAVIAVHLHGLMCEMAEMVNVCNDKNLFLIEDCAQAHGASYKGRKAGSFGDVGCFSFFPAKNLGCYGDGGATVTDSDHIKEDIDALRNHGRYGHKYEHKECGYNERLDNLQAAVLNVKLRYLDAWNKKRNAIAKIYSEFFENAGIITQHIPSNRWSSYYVYTLRIPHRERVQKKLKELGIHTGVYYPIPLHLQPAYSGLGYHKGDLPVSEKLCEEILSIPMHPFLDQDDIIDIATKVVGAVSEVK